MVCSLTNRSNTTAKANLVTRGFWWPPSMLPRNCRPCASQSGRRGYESWTTSGFPTGPEPTPGKPGWSGFVRGPTTGLSSSAESRVSNICRAKLCLGVRVPTLRPWGSWPASVARRTACCTHLQTATRDTSNNLPWPTIPKLAADITPCISVDPAVPAEPSYDSPDLNRVDDTHTQKEWKSYGALTQRGWFRGGKEKVPGAVHQTLDAVVEQTILLNGVIEHFSVPGGGRPVEVSTNARFLNTFTSRTAGVDRPDKPHGHALCHLRIRPGQQSRR